MVTVMPNKTMPVGGKLSSATVTPGAIQVTITPTGAVSAGAQWQIDNGAWQNSGAVLEGLSEGNHIITFSTAYKWVKA